MSYGPIRNMYLKKCYTTFIFLSTKYRDIAKKLKDFKPFGNPVSKLLMYCEGVDKLVKIYIINHRIGRSVDLDRINLNIFYNKGVSK